MLSSLPAEFAENCIGIKGTLVQNWLKIKSSNHQIEQFHKKPFLKYFLKVRAKLGHSQLHTDLKT